MPQPDAALALASELIFSRDRIAALLQTTHGIARARRKLNRLVADIITSWAISRDPDVVVFTDSLENVTDSASPPKYLLDFAAFRRGGVRPFIGAEFEWSFTRNPRTPENAVLQRLLPRLLPPQRLANCDRSQKERAQDILRLFVTSPEIAVFGGWLNPSGGVTISTEDLIESDLWIIEAYSSKRIAAEFNLLYLAVVRLDGNEYDANVYVFSVAPGRVERIR